MRRVARVLSVLAVVALAPSCSSDSKPAATGSSGASSTAPQGKVAVGDPVNIGFVNIQGGTTVSLPDYTVGANAAVEYANKELGGIAGRPVKLTTCFTNGTPESSVACGNQMVD